MNGNHSRPVAFAAKSERIARIDWLNPSDPQPPSRKKKETKNDVEWQAAKPGSLPDPKTLIGLEDAFDHTKFIPGEKIAYCKYDGVAYHLSTWEFLKTENHGLCCICGKNNVFAFTTLPDEKNWSPVQWSTRFPTPTPPPPDQLIGLKQVQDYLNLVVTVQDYVHDVYQTRSTGTYFIRFQPLKARHPVFEGFKLVIFPSYQYQWQLAGIDPVVYKGKTIRVRGLIQENEKWGMEIIVNSPRLIHIVGELPLQKTERE